MFIIQIINNKQELKRKGKEIRRTINYFFQLQRNFKVFRYFKITKAFMKILLKYIDKHGVKGLIAFIKMKIGKTQAIKMPNILYPIDLRSRTSDLPTFDQVFLGLEYNIDFTFQIERNIDAGGNIGLAAIYFANKYPNAKIISIEPEKDNFKMCLKNTKNYDNIIPMQKALSNNNGEELYIKDSCYNSSR